MKTTLLSLVLVSIPGLMYCSNSSMAVTQEPEDKELRALLESRRDVLRQALREVHASFRRGNGEPREYENLVIEAMNTELKLSRTKEERIAIITESLALLTKQEEFLHARIEGGFSTETSALLITRSNRLKVEIELHKARKAP